MNSAAHVEGLIRAFPSCRRVASDGLHLGIFEIIFEVNGRLYTLRIYLTNDFPTMSPKMQVIGGLAHTWLDSYSRITGCPTLNSWNGNASMLDSVVQDILLGLQLGVTSSQSMDNDSPPPAYEEVTSSSSAGREYNSLPTNNTTGSIKTIMVTIILNKHYIACHHFMEYYIHICIY
jgi:hypothetical protein